jgi:hypothetical protein
VCSGVQVLSDSTFEAGCGKTALNGSFGMASHLINSYVDAGHDVIGAADVIEALRASTTSYAVRIRIDQGEPAGGTHALDNISQVRHVTYDSDGSLRLFRHKGIGSGLRLSKKQADR